MAAMDYGWGAWGLYCACVFCVHTKHLKIRGVTPIQGTVLPTILPRSRSPSKKDNIIFEGLVCFASSDQLTATLPSSAIG
eukprot:scaffold49878_cov40-Tisochrysis_lutea.AAC.4